MLLRSVALAAVVATLCASCIARSTAMPAEAAAAPDAIQPLHHAGNRFLRAPGAEEEERGWFNSKLSAGAETLSKKKLKALTDQLVHNPTFYDDLVMADITQLTHTYAAWKGLGIKPKYLARSMEKAGFGDDAYKRFVDNYASFLRGDIRIE